MAPLRYVIIGGSAAGMAAAQAVRELDHEGEVLVLSAEADLPYFRPLIPFVVAEEKDEKELALLGNGPYAAQNIKVQLNAEVGSVDPGSKTVQVKNGDSIFYDKLLIATGSRPYLPPSIKGVEADGVYALRTLAEARSMADRVRSAKSAIMAGGGMLNLKTAFALLERGLDVSLVVTSPEVLSQVMEPDGASLIRDSLEEAGLKILTGRSIDQILSGKKGVKAVKLDSGEELPCEIVSIGKGVRPNVEFLAESGIDVDGGVVADPYTACSMEDIYTAGDVAVTFDPITGERMMTALWTNAVEMGRCAGKNMAGTPTAYGGTFGILNATQVAEVPFVSMGIVHTQGSDYEIHEETTAGVYRKLAFTSDGTRLIGAVFVGDITNAGLYRHLIRERVQLDEMMSPVIEHRLHYGHFLQL